MSRTTTLPGLGVARYHDDDRGKDMQLDEVCAEGHLHLERMDHNEVILVITPSDPKSTANTIVCIYADAPHRLRMVITEGEKP